VLYRASLQKCRCPHFDMTSLYISIAEPGPRSYRKGPLKECTQGRFEAPYHCFLELDNEMGQLAWKK